MSVLNCNTRCFVYRRTLCAFCLPSPIGGHNSAPKIKIDWHLMNRRGVDRSKLLIAGSFLALQNEYR